MMYSSVALRTRCRGQIKTGHTLVADGYVLRDPPDRSPLTGDHSRDPQSKERER